MKKLIFILLMLAFRVADADHCTTDTDCQQKHGGNGNPDPVGWYSEEGETVFLCGKEQVEMYKSIGLTMQDCDEDLEKFADSSDADTLEEYEKEFHDFILIKVIKHNKEYK